MTTISATGGVRRRRPSAAIRTTKTLCLHLGAWIAALCHSFRGGAYALQPSFKLDRTRFVTTARLVDPPSDLVSASKLYSSAQAGSSGMADSTNVATSHAKPTPRARSKHDVQWDKMYDLLSTYRDREGDANVKTQHVEDGENLGRWFRYQRASHKRGTLSADRRDKLESLGVIWQEAPRFDSKWDKMYDLLCTYHDREGNANVGQKHIEDGENLGTWLGSQRASHRLGTLRADRRDKLESLGVIWQGAPRSTSPQLDGQWDKMYDLLCTYHEREDNVNVQTQHVEDGENLGTWLGSQRASHRRGTLRADRRDKLESLGVIWQNAPVKQSSRNQLRWEKMFSHLVDYKNREGHCDVPLKYETSSGTGSEKLGSWLKTQRSVKRQGKLDPNRERRLENLGLEWDTRLRYWNEMFGLLVRYQKREGDCRVSFDHEEEGKQLGRWVRRTREHHRIGSLGADQFQALEKLGFEWHLGSEKWDEMYRLLVQYKERNGDCQVAQNHNEEGKNLGNWVSCQRKSMREGTLEHSKIDQLEEVGFVWDAVMHRWEAMFSLLVKYKEREGDCMVPQDHTEGGKKLGSWLTSQRENQRKEKLDIYKKDKLDGIGVVWDTNAFNNEEMVARLLCYKKREGHCNVPASYKEDDQSLGPWLHRQRSRRKSGNLDLTLSTRLEDAGVVWDMREQKWEMMFAILERFQIREGHCRVPQKHREEDQNLGLWLDRQRSKKKSGKLDTALQTRLEEIGVKWKIYAKFDDEDDENDWGFEGMDHLFDDKDMFG